MEKVWLLRKKYPRFIYEKYFWKVSKNNLEIFFNFRIGSDPAPEQARYGASIYFKPKVIIENIPKKLNCSRSDIEQLDNLIFHLGLIELLSYWKATCSPEIEIQASPLNKKQILWWKDLIMKGMGQFFYENKINFRKPDFLQIKSLHRSDLCQIYRGPTCVKVKNQILVPIGGGKDSVVTLEILKKAKKELSSFSLNPTEAAKKIMEIACLPAPRTKTTGGLAGCENPIIVRRKIDPKLLELNRRGFLNGHTPFSAYLAFLSVLVATIFGQKYIIFSNERSSNEGNLKYLGKVINHQWSKSFDFEKRFREYSKRYLAENIEYFSFLRPLYEIQIAKLFSKYPQYFNAFLSCNEAYKTDSGKKLPTRKWCGKCSKCLFVFAILYPFVRVGDLIKIFGKNLFEDESLLPTMLQLIEGEKPFECVGTKKESLVAFYLGWEKASRVGDIPFLLKYFEKKILPSYPNLERLSKRIMSSWSNQNFLPKSFERDLLSFTPLEILYRNRIQ